MATTKKPAVKKASSKVKDPYGEEHEKLLLVAHKNLPRLLKERLHTITPLNEALAKLAPERRERIEQKINEGKVTPSQAAIWRAIPDIQLPDEAYPTPKMQLGVTLYRHHEKNGTRKKNPDALCIADFVVDIEIPTWSVGMLAGTRREKKLINPIDGLYEVGLSRYTAVRIVGIIIPEHLTLGAALREIEKVHDAAWIDSEGRKSHPYEVFPLCVISREELFDVLSEKLDVMLVTGSKLHYDFGYIENQVTIDLAPSDIDWDDIDPIECESIN